MAATPLLLIVGAALWGLAALSGVPGAEAYPPALHAARVRYDVILPAAMAGLALILFALSRPMHGGSRLWIVLPIALILALPPYLLIRTGGTWPI